MRHAPADGSARLPIDRVFSMRGFGTVVTGTLAGGRLRVDRGAVVLPAGRRLKVRGLQVHGAAVDEAGAGMRVAVNLGGVEVADLQRGDTVTTAGAFVPSTRIDAAIELIAEAAALKHGGRVRFHQGASELIGRVILAGEIAALPPGQRAFGRIRLEQPAVVTRGDRFILRAYSPSVTIGGGWVLDPHPGRTPVRTPAGVARFTRLAGPEDEAVMAMIEERSAAGFAKAALGARAGLSADGAGQLRGALGAAGRILEAGSDLFAMSLVREQEQQLRTAVERHLAANPTSEGLPREEARERVFGAAPSALFDAVVQRLIQAGTLAGRERLTVPGRGIALTAEEAAARATIEQAYQAAGLGPPEFSALAAQARIAAATADRMLKLLIRSRVIVKVDSLLFHAAALEKLKADVRGLKVGAAPATLDVTTFKSRFGLSRKFAIPLLEWLDRERVTRRAGEARIVL